MLPVCLLIAIAGQEPELSEQWGCSQFTLTCRSNPSLTISPGQKLHDGGSKSQVEKKRRYKHLFCSYTREICQI